MEHLDFTIWILWFLLATILEKYVDFKVHWEYIKLTNETSWIYLIIWVWIWIILY